MTIRPHTTDTHVVRARLEVYDRILLGVTNTTAPLFREQTVLDLVEEPPVVPRVV